MWADYLSLCLTDGEQAAVPAPDLCSVAWQSFIVNKAQPRRQRGLPCGGQFAPSARADDPDIDLSPTGVGVPMPDADEVLGARPDVATLERRGDSWNVATGWSASAMGVQIAMAASTSDDAKAIHGHATRTVFWASALAGMLNRGEIPPSLAESVLRECDNWALAGARSPQPQTTGMLERLEWKFKPYEPFVAVSAYEALQRVGRLSPASGDGGGADALGDLLSVQPIDGPSDWYLTTTSGMGTSCRTYWANFSNDYENREARQNALTSHLRLGSPDAPVSAQVLAASIPHHPAFAAETPAALSDLYDRYRAVGLPVGYHCGLRLMARILMSKAAAPGKPTNLRSWWEQHRDDAYCPDPVGVASALGWFIRDDHESVGPEQENAPHAGSPFSDENIRAASSLMAVWPDIYPSNNQGLLAERLLEQRTGEPTLSGAHLKRLQRRTNTIKRSLESAMRSSPTECASAQSIGTALDQVLARQRMLLESQIHNRPLMGQP